MDSLYHICVILAAIIPAAFSAVISRRPTSKDLFYEMLEREGENGDMSEALADLYPCHPGSWYIAVYDPVTGSDKHQATLDMDEMSGWRFREHNRNVIYACAWGRTAPPSEWIRTFDTAVDSIKHVDTDFYTSWLVAPPSFARTVFLEISEKLREAGVRYRMLHVVSKGNGLHVRRHGPAARVRHRTGQFSVAILFDTNYNGEIAQM